MLKTKSFIELRNAHKEFDFSCCYNYHITICEQRLGEWFGQATQGVLIECQIHEAYCKSLLRY